VTGIPAGLRRWSALTGAWHTTVLLADRERTGEVRPGAPHHLQRSGAVSPAPSRDHSSFRELLRPNG
jgi:hypothetical protein